MSETPDVPIEQESSAISFDLGGLELDIEGTLEKLKGNSEALSQLHNMLSDALEKCSEAMAELEG
jgi:hypothetical protein